MQSGNQFLSISRPLSILSGAEPTNSVHLLVSNVSQFRVIGRGIPNPSLLLWQRRCRRGADATQVAEWDPSTRAWDSLIRLWIGPPSEQHLPFCSCKRRHNGLKLKLPVGFTCLFAWYFIQELHKETF